MGWCFGERTKEELVQAIIKAWHPSSGTRVETLAHTVRGSTLYAVREFTAPDGSKSRCLVVCLLKKDRTMGWGSKDMEESMAPYAYDCPLSYLDMVPDPGYYATEWRRKVREYHAARRVQKENRPEVGDIWSCVPGLLSGMTRATIAGTHGRGWLVTSETGRRFKIARKYLVERVGREAVSKVA